MTNYLAVSSRFNVIYIKKRFSLHCSVGTSKVSYRMLCLYLVTRNSNDPPPVINNIFINNYIMVALLRPLYDFMSQVE